MPTRRKIAIEKRRKEVVEYYRKGLNIIEIGDKIGVHFSQISRDIKHVFEEWKKESIEDLSLIKSRELSKLDLIEQRAWEDYEASRALEDGGFKIKTHTKQIIPTDSEGKDSKPFITERRIEREKAIGDPRYFQIILQCMDRRARLLGLDEIVELEEIRFRIVEATPERVKKQMMQQN